VSAGAFRVVLRYLYTAELPESEREGLVQDVEDSIFDIPFVKGTANRDNLPIGGMRELCDRLGAKKELARRQLRRPSLNYDAAMMTNPREKCTMRMISACVRVLTHSS